MPAQTGLSFARRFVVCLCTVAVGASAALALFFLVGGPAHPAYAGTHTYPGCGGSIQSCIDSANAGDTILISAGDYTESLTLSKAVSLTGELSSTTILHALPNSRVLTVTGAAVDASVIISGLTFTGGNITGTLVCPDGCGGGIMITGTAQPRLEHVILAHNSAYYGGGLFNTGNTALTDSTITSNTAVNTNSNTGGRGGGMYNLGGTLTITGSAIINNVTTDGFGLDSGGGGVYNLLGTLTISASSITGNSNAASHYADDDGGGGVYNFLGTLTITGSSIASNNSATSGGGVDNLGTLTIDSSTITGNTAGTGGGVLNFGSTLTITSSSITSNTAGVGGGAANYGGSPLTIDSATIIIGSRLTIDSSTIISNAATYGGGVYNIAGTLTINGSSVSDNAATFGGGVFNDNSASNSQVVNALFAGNAASQQGAALYMASPGSLTFLYSTIVSSTLGKGAAIVVAAGTVGITDTIIASYTTGISQTAGSVFQDYNLFYGNGTNISGTISGGVHSLIGDPKFVDTAGGNYHITAASAARGKGVNVGVNTDFEGDPRPNEGGFDIGFDQFLFQFRLFLPLARR